jgi:hypothetical protein
MKTLKLPSDLETFFNSSLYGLEGLLPCTRQSNKELIHSVYECLLKEKYFTKHDITHLRSFKQIVKLIKMPEFYDAKSLIEAEVFLEKQIGNSVSFDIRFVLEYLFFLFVKYELIDSAVSRVRVQLCIWRLVQRFRFLDHNVLAHYIDWLSSKGFSPKGSFNSLRELFKFCRWLEKEKLRFEEVNDLILSEYLFQRASKLKPATKCKIITDLKPFMVFFKEELDNSFMLLSTTATYNKNKYIEQKLSSDELLKLREAVAREGKNIEAALMLHLMICEGVPFKALPLIELKHKQLVYEFSLPSRLGRKSKIISLVQNSRLEELISKLTRDENCKYLFQSVISRRKNKPVGVDYCQEKIQSFVFKVLRFTVSVVQICRDDLKNRSKGKKLTQFIDETKAYETSKKTKLNYWLCSNH